MNSNPILFALVAIALALCCNAAVVQVSVISRHGDRGPLKGDIIPNNPVDWMQEIGVAPGQLTSVGMNQCYQLGTHLYSRYFNPQSPNKIQSFNYQKQGCDASYNELDFLFHSSDVDRTLMSVQSIGLGMFGQQKGCLPQIGDYTLQPLPIHTVAKDNDMYIRGFEICPAETAILRDYAENSPVFAAKEEASRELLANITSAIGAKKQIRLKDFSDIADALYVMRVHNLLRLPAIENMWDDINDLGNWLVYQRFSSSVFKSKFKGSINLLADILKNMQAFIDGKPAKRYIHYSAHDSTLMSMIGTLRLDEDYGPDDPEMNLQGIPPYASAMAFELHKEGDEYFVRILFRKGADPATVFKTYKLGSLGGKGCAENCPFNSLKSLVESALLENNKLEHSTQYWCSYCGNEGSNACIVPLMNGTRTSYNVLLVFFSLALVTLVGTLAASLYIHKRKAKRYQDIV